MLLLLQPLSSMPNRSTTFYLTALRRAEGPLQLSCKLSKQALLPLASFLVVKQKVIRSQTESQQHTPLTQILDNVALNSQIVIQPTEQPINSQPNKRTTRSQITSHYHHATQAFTQKTTPPIQHINIINPITYQVHNNPTFEFADHPAPSSQRRHQRKRRCEILNIPRDLPSLDLPPLRTTHIQQELWTYKKDKAFSVTPTEAINTLYLL